MTIRKNRKRSKKRILFKATMEKRRKRKGKNKMEKKKKMEKSRKTTGSRRTIRFLLISECNSTNAAAATRSFTCSTNCSESATSASGSTSYRLWQ